jgi:hypothetical protein
VKTLVDPELFDHQSESFILQIEGGGFVINLDERLPAFAPESSASGN